MTSYLSVDQLESELFRMVDEIENKDATQALDDCREPIAQGFADIFTEQVAADGSRWPEHSPVTVAIHGPHELLILTTALYTSLTDWSDGAHIESNSGRSMSYGTNLVYAGTQNYGMGNIPARQYMFIKPDTQDKCVSVIADWLEDEIINTLGRSSSETVPS